MRAFSDNHKYRIHHPTLGWGDHEGGCFVIADKGLVVIASNGGGWDHVSISMCDRCPTWEEMQFVKRLFFKDDEDVFQLHPAERNYKNFHPHCLHLWRPQKGSMPMPPTWMVAP